jgi:glycosyltransferase involved in cell wall biosynthesis
MKIAYVTPYYNGDCDGRFGRFHDWVHTARDMESPPFDFDVYAFTVSNDDETLATEPHGILGEATELWGTKLNKAEFLLNARKIRSALQSGEYDLIHIMVMDLFILPTVFSLQPDVPVVVGPDIAGWSPIRKGVFANESPTTWLKNRTAYLLKNLLSRSVPFDHAVVFSKHHQNMLETFGIPSSKTSIIQGGVSERFGQPGPTEQSNPPELLYVGDFSAHKGYTLFLEAVAGIDIPFTLRLVGAGDANKGLLENLGLLDRTVVDGFIPRDKLPEIYARADLYVNPSIDETAGPNTQLEALVSGTPVVATDTLGINEFAPTEATVLFSPRDVDSLRHAIEQAIIDLEDLTEGAMQIAPHFLATKTLANLEEIYTGIVANTQ